MLKKKTSQVRALLITDIVRTVINIHVFRMHIVRCADPEEFFNCFFFFAVTFVMGRIRA